MELTKLKAEVTTTQTTRDKEQTTLATIQGDLEKARTELDGLRKQEQKLAKEIATATTEFSSNAEVAAKSLASLSKTAAETLQQIADKATELNNALKSIAVPSPPAIPTETEANKTTPEEGSDKQ
jgi:chromosome segregation ATPase